MKEAEVEAFLTHLAVEDHVSASTQNQALSAILFLYRHILKCPLAESMIVPLFVRFTKGFDLVDQAVASIGTLILSVCCSCLIRGKSLPTGKPHE